MEIAIITVAYNRVNSLLRLLNSLNNSYYEEDNVTLIISVDKSKTDEVEKLAESYEWNYGKKIVDKHMENLGLRQHMLSLGKWFENFNALIVLEDDIVVAKNYYIYAKQCIEKYHNCIDIAGISLYGFDVNYQTGLPFKPLKDKNDIYFMNCAMSWGEIWLRNSWLKFYEWYKYHQDFPMMNDLPKSICLWNNKSWLKYHTRYCIENKKFFVYPYVSLSTNFGDTGEHSDGNANVVYQVELQHGLKKNYFLPEFGEDAIYYDGFFENISIYKSIGIDISKLCIDLNGEWKNRLNKQYWLTTEVKDYKIIKSFGLNYRPIELNILLNNPGHEIFLYDVMTKESNPNKISKKRIIMYFYYLHDLMVIISKIGYSNLLRDFVIIMKNKIKKIY